MPTKSKMGDFRLSQAVPVIPRVFFEDYFPDKPWNVHEFENETTGVVPRYDGIKWVATSDSDPS